VQPDELNVDVGQSSADTDLRSLYLS